MLGRYVAGTVLVLGVAMLLAPSAPEREEPEPEARDTAPAAAPQPETLAAPAETATADAGESDAEPDEMRQGIEQALADALALDAAEGLNGTDESEPAAGGEPFSNNQTSAKVVRPPTPAPQASEPAQQPAPQQPFGQAAQQMALQAATEELQSPVAEPTEPSAELVPEVSPDASAPDRLVLYVTGTNVNVRAGPSTEYRVVGTVSAGQAVELLSSEGGWAQILFGDEGYAGFMSRQFLDYEPVDG